jgi:hypothetical protein
MNNPIDESNPRDQGSLPAGRIASSRQPKIESRSWFNFIMTLLKEAILVRIAPRTRGGRVRAESGLLNGVAKPEVVVPPLAPHLAKTHSRSR